MTTAIIIIFSILLIDECRCSTSPQDSANSGGTTKVSSGSAVDPPHKYPFMVELHWSGYVPNTTEPLVEPRHACGASIIDKHWIMTAAHCFANVTTSDFPTSTNVLTLLTGVHRPGKLEPWSQNITIVDFIGPSILYKRSGYFGYLHTIDIVLARLATPIIFSDKVTPVNLPPIDFEVVEDFQDIATVIGWGERAEGLPSNGSQIRVNELQESSVPLMTTETCQRRAGVFQYIGRHGEVRYSTFDVSEFSLCVGLRDLRPEVGVGACYGDSGGPVLLYNSKHDTYFQVGIVSAGHCWHDVPHVDTNVGKYVHWIKWNTKRCHWRNVSRSYPVDD